MDSVRVGNTYPKTLSSIQSSSGAAGAWAIILNVDSVANIAVNDFCLVPYNVSGGTRPETLCGCWIVTNVDAVNTRITVTSTHRYTSAPSGAVAGTLTIVKTILYYNGVNGIVLTSRNNLGLLNKLVLLGNGTSYGISLDTGASLIGGTSLGISAFAYGVLCQSHAHIESDQIKISNCGTFGVRVYYATARMAYSVVSGNTTAGISLSASKGEFSTSVCSGNGTTGFGTSGSAHAGIYAGQSTYNTLFGFYVESNSFIDARTSTATGSGTTYSPAIDTVGNVQAFIWFT